MELDQSRFTVQAFAGGLLSFMAHSPTFAVGDFEGELHWQPDTPGPGALDVIVRAESLELTDDVRPADRQEIESRMRREVLEADAYPEVRFQAAEITTTATGQKQYRLRIAGMLSLRGLVHRQAFDADVRLYDDGIRMGGAFPLRLSDYRIQPVTALGGTIRLQDQLKVSYDILAYKEAS
jgi:polyisoprenoid-binding protein YceI